MKTYDQGARTFGKHSFWRNLKALLWRTIDRERELIILRNAVGMLAEARRGDADEYQAMIDGNREARADARRLRWLMEDHADVESRTAVRSIASNLAVKTLSTVRKDIDAAMIRQGGAA